MYVICECILSLFYLVLRTDQRWNITLLLLNGIINFKDVNLKIKCILCDVINYDDFLIPIPAWSHKYWINKSCHLNSIYTL